jgi:hypothetical protein
VDKAQEHSHIMCVMYNTNLGSTASVHARQMLVCCISASDYECAEKSIVRCLPGNLSLQLSVRLLCVQESVLINVGRGNVVKNASVLRALK